MKKYNITPVAKPRMTKSDRWKKRPAVEKYWNFKDEVRRAGVKLRVSGNHILFIVPMPSSWSEKKKFIMNGKPHQSRPDVDNFCKGIFDALFNEDSLVWDVRITKRWGYDGAIVIEDQ